MSNNNDSTNPGESPPSMNRMNYSTEIESSDDISSDYTSSAPDSSMTYGNGNNNNDGSSKKTHSICGKAMSKTMFLVLVFLLIFFILAVLITTIIIIIRLCGADSDAESDLDAEDVVNNTAGNTKLRYATWNMLFAVSYRTENASNGTYLDMGIPKLHGDCWTEIIEFAGNQQDKTLKRMLEEVKTNTALVTRWVEYQDQVNKGTWNKKWTPPTEPIRINDWNNELQKHNNWVNTNKFEKCQNRSLMDLINDHDFEKRKELVKEKIENYFGPNLNTNDLPSILCLQETWGWKQYLKDQFNKEYMVIQDPFKKQYDFNSDKNLGVACLVPKKRFNVTMKGIKTGQKTDGKIGQSNIQHGALIFNVQEKNSKKHLVIGTMHLFAIDPNLAKDSQKKDARMNKRKSQITWFVNTVQEKVKEVSKANNIDEKEVVTVFGGDLNTQWDYNESNNQAMTELNQSVYQTANDLGVKRLDNNTKRFSSNVSDRPLYTTRAQGFKEKIDHIMTMNRSNIAVESGSIYGDEEWANNHGSPTLPNSKWPSDHRMLNVEFRV